MASTMDAIELHQFIRILLVAVGALIAAPIVLFLADPPERGVRTSGEGRGHSIRRPATV